VVLQEGKIGEMGKKEINWFAKIVYQYIFFNNAREVAGSNRTNAIVSGDSKRHGADNWAHNNAAAERATRKMGERGGGRGGH
jgi:hypothetical protein